jgi:hypothetical protein
MSDSQNSKEGNPQTPSGEKEAQGSYQKNTLLLLRAFAKTYRKIDIGFDAFVDFVSKYVDQYGNRYKQLQIFEKNTREILATNLKALARKRQCELVYRDGNLERIDFPQYFSSVLEKAYTDLETTPDLPFPDEETLGLPIPPNLITAVNIQSGLASYLREEKPASSSVLRLLFPENLGTIVAAPSYIPNQLLEHSIQKIKLYLSQGNNASYVQSRLRPGFITNPNLLREMINSVVIKPGNATASFIESSDLTFRFWANLTNLIIKEYKEKKDMLALERDICKAAYILGIFNVYFRETVKQRADEKKNVLVELESQLHNPPYIYSLNDIYALKDKSGAPLITPDSKENTVKFLETKTRPKPKQILPDLMQIQTPDRKEYFIYKDHVPTVFVQRLNEASEELRAHYTSKWLDAIWRNEKPEAMMGDQAFLQDLTNIVHSYYPLLRYFLNYNLLTGVEKDVKINYDLVPEYDRCLDRRNYRLKQLDEILHLDRKTLARETKNQLPFWGKTALTRKLGLMLAKIFKGLGRAIRESRTQAHVIQKRKPVRTTVIREQPGGGKTLPAEKAKMVVGRGGSKKRPKSKAVDSRVAYNKALLELKDELIGEHASIPTTLSALIEKWNPLYEPQARKNLVEDVNAMIRDFMRGLRHGIRHRPPDAARVRSLATKLSQNSVFERIKQKEHFKRYIEVYMLKLLGEK